SFFALFFLRPAVFVSPFFALFSLLFVVLLLPAFSLFPLLLFLLCGGLVSGFLFRSSPVGFPGVFAPVFLFRCAFFAFFLSLALLVLRLWLFAAVFARFRFVFGFSPCVPFACFLSFFFLLLFLALFRCLFSGFCFFLFPFGRSVRSFFLVCRLPVLCGFFSRPFRLVSVCGLFLFLTVAVFLFALVVI
ncbi:hypothetical protein, partial [Escherichia coli]|uniref:hypothetical protein n=1 Tax=Escherichia coli TaxID=562 RepID=UPI00209722FC